MGIDNQIKIIITEDKLLYRKVIKRELEALSDFNISVIGEANNGVELLQQLEYLKPDVILLDLEMPIMDGNVTFNHLRDKYPEMKIIVVSYHSSPILMEDYLNRGAKDHIDKDEIANDVAQLAAKIRKAHLGKPIYRTRNNNDLKLKEIQKDIVQLKATGKSNEEIGEEIGMTSNGVGKQLKKIRLKMGIESLDKFYHYITKSGLEFLRMPKKN